MTELVTTVRQLLLYTLWADRICLKAVEAVRPEDLAREIGTSFGSLLGTLAHILGAQSIWLARFEGKTTGRVPGLSDFPDFEALNAGWAESSAELGFFLASLTEDQVQSEITWSNSRGETFTRALWQPVLHLANHSTYHRGQVISLLRQLGYPAPSTDLIYFLLEQSA